MAERLETKQIDADQITTGTALGNIPMVEYETDFTWTPTGKTTLNPSMWFKMWRFCLRMVGR